MGWWVCLLLLGGCHAVSFDLVNETEVASLLRSWKVGRSPRNISTIFSGSWKEQTLGAPVAAEMAGHITMDLTNRVPSIGAQPFDYINGDLVLRDSVYAHEGSTSFKVEGLYFYEEGVLYLTGSPAGEDLFSEVYNGTRGANDSTHLSELFEDGAASPPMLVDDMKECYLKVYARVAPPYYHGGIPPASWPRESELLAVPIEERPTANLTGYVSTSCGRTLAFTTQSFDYEHFFRKALGYVMMNSVVSVVQVVILIRQLGHTRTDSDAAKVSVLSVGQLLVMNCYSCLQHLTSGITLQPIVHAFNAFALAAFFKFVAFSVFEWRYLWMIWKARRPQLFNDDEVRRELSFLYTRFYLCFVVSIMVLYHFHGELGWFAFVMLSYWVPQIAVNCQRDTSGALDFYYVIGNSLTRLVIPMYVHLCEKNVLHARGSPWLFLFLCVWVGLQTGVLLAQDKYGPRFFVPQHWRPHKYSYHVPAGAVAAELLAADCVVCMSPALEDVGNPGPFERSCMVTPCQHVFHTPCLEQWMGIRLECPTCRQELPPT